MRNVSYFVHIKDTIHNKLNFDASYCSLFRYEPDTKSVKYHTTEEEMKQLTHFLKFFRPFELAFLIDLGKRLSKYDSERNERIRSLFNVTFKTDQTIQTISHALTYFERNPTLSFSHDILMDEIVGVQLEPFTSTCPICSCNLRMIRCSVKSMKMHCLKGRTIEGIEDFHLYVPSLRLEFQFDCFR